MLGHKLGYSDWINLMGKDTPSLVSVVMDENTAEHCWPVFQKVLPRQIEPQVVVMPSGETHKSLDMVQYCWQQWLSAEAGRDMLVIALGGGVVTDLVHFAANTFKRGVDCMLAPTSLLGMVDAAVGGKTGINLGGYKNVIGSFAEPKAVWIDTQFLQTLPDRELHNGLAETLKHGIIEGKGLWRFLKSQPGLKKIQWERLVAESLQVKIKLVKRDFRDKGIRQLLNLGHTFGHALESWAMKTDEPLQHGEAVAIGMVYITWLAHFSHKLSKRSANTITKTIRHFFPNLSLEPYTLDELQPYLQQDKKKEGTQVHYTLPYKAGQVRYGEVITDAALHEKAFLATQSIFKPSWA